MTSKTFYLTTVPPKLKVELGLAQTTTRKVRAYKIEVCARVNLWIANEGFTFCHAKFDIPDTLQNWEDWEDYYPLYLKDGLASKVYAFLDTLPERFRSQAFYQAIHF